MFEQDYIMRQIKEMVRAILKLLFNIETEAPINDLLEQSEKKEVLEAILNMVDDGRISEAEDRIFEITEDLDKNNLEAALLFYSYLNDKPDGFLEENNFSRDEVERGLKDILSRYGLDSLVTIFMESI